MSRKQKIVLWIGIGLFVAMGIFPPIEKEPYSGPPELRIGIRGSDERVSNERVYWEPLLYDFSLQYGFLLTVSASELFFIKLLIQWFIVAVLTGALLITFKTPKQD